MRILHRTQTTIPTAVDITPQLIARAADALIIEDAQENLRDIYGKISKARAQRFAKSALEAALDLRRED